MFTRNQLPLIDHVIKSTESVEFLESVCELTLFIVIQNLDNIEERTVFSKIFTSSQNRIKVLTKESHPLCEIDINDVIQLTEILNTLVQKKEKPPQTNFMDSFSLN
jgi:hypothetical protein